jgi:N-methylhydantoinase A
LVGGALRLNAEKARSVLEETIARRFGMSIEQAAYGAHQIAASNMIRAIKAVSTERGRDPREFALFAFGGNGPLFACAMASALGMTRVVVPPCAGLFSSFGLLYAEVEHHYGRTFRRLLRKCDLDAVERAWATLAQQATEQLAADGFTGLRAELRRTAALHYQGQTYELTVPVPEGPIDQAMVFYLEEAFGREHEKTYGHRASSDEPVELVTIQVIGHGVRPGAGVPERVRPTRPEPLPPPPRQAYFGTQTGWVQTPVIRRSELSSPLEGPVIVEEYDATCVIAPGWRARLDTGGNILIELI